MPRATQPGQFRVGRTEALRNGGGVTPQEKIQALEAARAAGIDLELVESNLALSHEERALRHESALELALALREAGIAHEKSFVGDPAAR